MYAKKRQLEILHLSGIKDNFCVTISFKVRNIDLLRSSGLKFY